MTASDMHQALQTRQVKGTTAVVCEIERSQSIKVDRISNFSAFHNFSYGAGGVRISKAYEIGPGKLIPRWQLNFQGQGPILVNEVSAQGFFAVTPRRMKLSMCEIQDSEKESALFECKEPGCSYVFTTFEELLKIIFRSYLEDTFRVFQRIRKACTIDYAEASGWALQKPRRGRTRFSEKVKSYLTARFDVGTKSNPSQVATDMRTTRNADDSRKFSGDEWLTKGQVQSFFSRLSAISRKTGVTRAENVESDDEGDLQLHEEMACLIDERRDKEIEDIFNGMGVMHPIMYDGYDICEQTKQEGLSKSNVKTLKYICENFELSFKS